MAKKKTVKKAAKKAARKVPILVEPNPVETEIKLVPVEVEDEVASPAVAPKPKVVPAPAAPKVKYERESAKKGWSEMEKGYPPPEDVESEYTTATGRVFAVKKHLYLEGKYPRKKLIFPLD